MPYNNAPIAPSEEISGSSALPLARVKKIIASDDEIAQCSNGAAFAVSVATEHFLRYLTEQSYNVVKSEKKPRRNIAYKDVATAVSRIDNLEFLSDIVPKTKTYRQIKEDQAREEAAAKAKAKQPPSGATGESSTKPIEQMMQRQGMTNGQLNGGQRVDVGDSADQLMPKSPLVHRTVIPNGHGHGHGHSRQESSDDVDMVG